MMKRVLVMMLVMVTGLMLCLPASLAATTIDPGVWTELHPASAPSARMWSAMTYDSASDKTILFGGFTGSGNGETWAYDSGTNTWTNMNPPVSPSARWNHKMAYDSQSNRVIMFGGWTGYAQSGETWAYEFQTNEWTNMNPVVAPSARNAHAMAYDSQSDRVILFGGHTGLDNDETWSYDFETNSWTDMNPALRPPARHDMAFAYDIQSDRFLMFGGEGGGSKPNDLWSYDLESNAWIEMHPVVTPPNSYGTAFAYDSHADRTVMFGGDDPNPPYVRSDTWAYDLDGDAWTKIDTSGPGRSHHAMAYDSRSARSIMFGGDISPPTVFLDDTWAFCMPSSKMVIQDPNDDIVPRLHNIPEYMDIASAGLAKEGGVWVFSMEMAYPIPDEPAPHGIQVLMWIWKIDTVQYPAFFYVGWMGPPNRHFIWEGELNIVITWEGGRFSAFLIDARPQLAGGQVIRAELTPFINGNELSVGVDASTLGDLSGFLWSARTIVFCSQTSATDAIFAADGIGGYYPWQP